VFGDAKYSSGEVRCAADDLFGIFTDGLVETTDAWEEEFGLKRLENILCEFAGRPLALVYDAALDAVRRHRRQRADRRPMLVGVRSPRQPLFG